jgi:periplasmic divalent cation tolerance protein
MTERRPVDRSGDVALVLTTVPDMAVGESMIRVLVDERRIACGNLVPGVLSIYRWEGEVVREQEVLAVLKTAAASVESVFNRITELHPYSVPELVELEARSVARTYRDWVLESSKVSA